MEFKILGPLEVRDRDRELSCKGAKQRLLLAVLLTHANEVVSSDRLIEALWGERPPESASKALQMHVSQLRKLLEPDRSPRGSGQILQTRPPGYALRVEPGQLDLQRFEQAVTEARAASAAGRMQQAATTLRDALALWRGPPLADLSVADALQEDIARLEELHLVAVEDRIEADLALGRHAGLIGELESLVSRHPLRERLRAQLMLALYRASRQAEALEVYRDTRRALVDELGIEPGRELKDLQRRVLAQDPSLDAALEPRVQSAQPAETLVGRERELAELVPLIDGALSGRSALILVGGEPGIGKSRLADALAGHADRSGARVVVGRCWEAGGAPSYWPWIQALRSFLRGTDPQVLRSHLPPGGRELLAILPEIGELLPDPADSHGADAEGARFRLFESVASLLRSAGSREPLAVFLDDLHAADAPSLLLLRFVAGQLAGTPLMIVGCYRDTQVGPDLAEALAELSREPVVHRLTLTGLDDAETSRLLELTMGRAPTAELAARVHAETQGNPLFAAEIGRLLASERPDGHASGGLPIPAAVREAIGRRLRRQSEQCRDVLALASVIGREFGLDALERVSGLEEGELFEALEEAAAARLVGSVPGTGGRLRFSHMLVRDALYEELAAPRRLRLHRRIGEALEDLYAGNPTPHVAELAHHYLEAGTPAAEKAMAFAERAGDRAASQHGYEEAARHYTSALGVVEAVGSGDEQRECRLLLSLGDVLSRAGDALDAKRALRSAAAIAEEKGWADLLAQAALGYGGRFAWARASTDPALAPLLERALEALGDDDGPTRVRLLARLAAARRDDPRRERRVALAAEALEIANRSGDPATLAHALQGHWSATEGPQSADDTISLDEMLSLGEQVGDREVVFAARDHRLHMLWTLADRAGVDVELDALRALADELRQPAQRWSVGTCRTMLALMEGRFEEAEELISETLALGQGAQSWNAVVSQRVELFVLRRAQGRLAELEDTIRRSVHEYPAQLRFRCALAHLYGELGRDAEARTIFDDLLSRDLGREHVDAEWLFSMSLLPDVCGFLGDEHPAAKIYALLLPYERLYAQAPVEASFGSVARGLGVVATTLRRFEEAERQFDAAIEIERRMRARPWLAHAQHGLAAMLLTRGTTDDRERAARLLDEVQDAYRALGMESWATRAAALAGE